MAFSSQLGCWNVFNSGGKAKKMPHKASSFSRRSGIEIAI
jgi:hypothetical protein